MLVVFDDDDDDDDVFLRRKPRDDVVSFRSLSLSLFLGVRERPNGAFDKTEDDGEVLTRSLFRTPHSTRS